MLSELRSSVEGRPESVVRHVRKHSFRVGRHGDMGVHRLWAVIVAEQVLTGNVESGIFFQIVGPIRYGYEIAGLLRGFDRILIHGGINKSKVVDDLGSLGALAGAQESRNGYGGEQGNDRYHNHDFHEGKAPAFGCEFLEHTRS